MEIVIYPDKRLRKKCEEVKIIDEKFLSFLETEFFQIMIEKDGIGLAGPQVGISERFFVFDTTAADGVKKIVINPVIISFSAKKVIYEEGCLSFPYIYANVERSEKAKVKYTNSEGKEVVEDLDGLNARVFQHEYDHLDGILFIDRLSQVEKLKIKKQLMELKKDSNAK